MNQFGFPFTAKVKDGEMTFNTLNDLYKYYYQMPINEITAFSRQFWALGINLVKLIHSLK